jgi:hypothetical protein
LTTGAVGAVADVVDRDKSIMGIARHRLYMLLSSGDRLINWTN